MIKASAQLSETIKKLIRYGLTKQQIINRLMDSGDYSPAVIEESVESVTDSYANFPFIQKVVRSTIVADQESDILLILDPISRSAEPVTKERLKDAFGAKGYNYTERIMICRFSYNPFIMKQVYKDEFGNYQYNEYVPPFWQKDYFYSEGLEEIEHEDELPEIYQKYFKHLVNDHEESYNYTLDWAANALQDRNFCMLVTIGKQGIGKGVLGDIFKNVFGDANYAKTGPDFFKKNFNSQVLNRRIVYFDEISIKDREQEEKLKAVINTTIEVEQKHKDAKLVRNYSSFYISSNSMDAIKIYGDDRRYSIIELTDKPLTASMSKKEIEQLLAKDNIDKLARYLLARPVDKDRMMKVFSSSRKEEIRSASLAAWHDWFLDDYASEHLGKTVTMKEVAKLVEDEYGSRFRPGRGAFQDLQARFPEKFEVYKTLVSGKQTWMLKFKGVENEEIRSDKATTE